MPISEAKRKANEKYLMSQDDIKIRVAKGQREVIRSYAEKKGMSLNGYIKYLIEKDMSENPN